MSLEPPFAFPRSWPGLGHHEGGRGRNVQMSILRDSEEAGAACRSRSFHMGQSTCSPQWWPDTGTGQLGEAAAYMAWPSAPPCSKAGSRNVQRAGTGRPACHHRTVPSS